jgi:alanine dehydrogenase
VSEPVPVRVLGAHEVAELLPLDDCIAAVEEAFRWQACHRDRAPASLGFPATGGSFHVKAMRFGSGEEECFVAKVNGNFPDNGKRHGLPTVQGVLMLANARNGRPLAVMDSGEITLRRTAAATAVAARHLARRDARIATLCGCGRQGRAIAEALLLVLPLKRFFVYDLDAGRARTWCDDRSTHACSFEPVRDLAAATLQSQVVVTCTPSTRPLIGPEAIPPGCFVAGVGADNPDKVELHPLLLAAARVVVDDLEQCAKGGDLHHALAASSMTRDSIHGDLAAVVAGLVPGRTHADERFVFDSTGIALEDACAAWLVYQRALVSGKGLRVELAA